MLVGDTASEWILGVLIALDTAAFAGVIWCFIGLSRVKEEVVRLKEWQRMVERKINGQKSERG